MPFNLRPYQIEALDKIRDGMRRDIQAQVLCLPTGGGKTVIAAEILRAAAERGSRAWFVADREALVFQSSRRLTEAGLDHGLLMGEYTRARHERIQVASIQTIEKRGGFFADLDLVIFDECHEVREFVRNYIKTSRTPTIGLSATPFTPGLGKVYDRVVTARTANQLLADKWLTPLRVFCPTPIDMTGAQKSGGEWSKNTVASRAIPIVGDVVSEWVAKTTQVFGGPVTTLVFGSSVAHVEELVRAFGEAGYQFAAVTYRSDKDPKDRQAKIRAAEEGRICGLVSVDALGKGLDIPTVRCLVSARPFANSLASWIQQLGRGMRIADGKDSCVLLDHARNWLRFADEVEDFWERGIDRLHKGDKKRAGPRKPREEREHVCRGCKLVLPKGAPHCPVCGLGRPRRRANVPTEAGTLHAYQANRGRTGSPSDPWPDLCRLAVNRGIKNPEQWARFRYRELVGRFPKWGRAFEPGRPVRPLRLRAGRRELPEVAEDTGSGEVRMMEYPGFDEVDRAVYRTHLVSAVATLELARVHANQNGSAWAAARLLEIEQDIEELLPAEPGGRVR